MFSIFAVGCIFVFMLLIVIILTWVVLWSACKPGSYRMLGSITHIVTYH